MSTQRNAHQLTSDHIVLSHFTLGRHHDIVNRLDAAAAAGCAGVGLYIRDYLKLDPGLLRSQLDERNLCLAEIEALRGWDPSDREYQQLETAAFEMADAFGCRYVQAIGPYAGSFNEASKAFGQLCDRAAEHDLVVGLEFLPFTNIYDAADALRMIEQADRDNGGMCVDIWHHQRGANDLDLIRAIPGEKVMAVQLSDGPVMPTMESYYEDCLRTRVPPGAGEMDIAGFIDAIRSTGANVPWDLEVCNDDVWDTDATDFVKTCADGLRTFL